MENLQLKLGLLEREKEKRKRKIKEIRDNRENNSKNLITFFRIKIYVLFKYILFYNCEI